MLRISRRYIFVVILLILSIFSIVAKGESEGIEYTLEDADGFIEDRNYNEAIRILTIISRDNPELFEEIQNRIRDIRSIQDEYNEKYEELMVVLFDNEDYETALELIKELETLVSNPNETTQNAITDARISAELVFNRKVFNQIMDQALVFLDEGKYQQAVKLYQTGFSLHRQTFDEREYGDVIKGPVYLAIEDLEELLIVVETEWDQQQEYTNIAINYWRNGAQENQLTDYNEAITWFENYQQRRNTIYQTALLLNNQNELLNSISDDYSEDFYLSFMNRLLTGRKTNDRWEGIVTALDDSFQNSFDLIMDASYRELNTRYVQVYSTYQSRVWNDDALINSWFDREMSLSNKLYDVEHLIDYYDDDGVADKYTLARTSLITPKEIWLESLAEAKEEYSQLDIIKNRIDNRQIDFQDQFNNLQLISQYSVDQSEDISIISQLENQYTESLVNFNNRQFVGNEELSEYKQLIADTKNLYNNGRIIESDIVIQMALLDFTAIDGDYNDYENRLELGEALIVGSEVSFDNDETFEIIRYPERALNDIVVLKNQYLQLQENLERYENFYSERSENLFNNNEVISYIENIREYLTNLPDKIDKLDNLQINAEDYIALAQRDLYNGNLLYNDAANSLRINQFENARNEISDSFDLYVSALSYNEEIDDRDTLLNRVQNLRTEITNAEQALVVEEVRVYINTAKQLNQQGRYAQSEQVLMAAQDRWEDTNEDENEEVESLLKRVRTALSIESGRTLERTNPLYNEFSQLLNLAHRKYDEGIAEINAGRRPAGLRLLNEADQYLQQLLVPLPLNQAVRVLQLRILQYTSPIFDTVFEDRYQEAIAKINDDPGEAYNDLVDLQSIKPVYKDIAYQIQELKYELGIEIRQPSPEVIAISYEYYNRALQIEQSGNRAAYPDAINILITALDLYPDNVEAQVLKDRLSIYYPTTETPPIPDYLMGVYEQAVASYRSGQYFEADQLLRQVEADPTGAANRDVILLRSSIDARIR